MNKIGIALAGTVVLIGVSMLPEPVPHLRTSAAKRGTGQSRSSLCENIVNHASRGEKKGLRPRRGEHGVWRNVGLWIKSYGTLTASTNR